MKANLTKELMELLYGAVRTLHVKCSMNPLVEV